MFIMLIFPVLAIAQTESTNEELADKAEELVRYEEYDKAIAIYKKLIDNNYDKARMYSELGLIHFYKKNYKKAKENFRMAVLFGLDDPISLANIGAAYNELEDFEKAWEYNQKALSKKVNSQTVSNAIAVLNNLERYDEALEVYNKYAKNDVELMNEISIILVNAETHYFLENFWEAASNFQWFFEKYTPDKKFPVNLEQEKRYMLYSVTMGFAEDNFGEGDADDTVYYGDYIKEFYREFSPKKDYHYFFWLEQLANNKILYRPARKAFFEDVLRSSGQELTPLQKIRALRISGKYDQSYKLANSLTEVIDGYTDAEMQIYYEMEKYMALLYKFNDDAVSRNYFNKDVATELKILLRKIMQSENVIEDGSRFSGKAYMQKITEKLAVNLLYNYNKPEYKSFMMELLMIADYNDRESDWDHIIENMIKNGTF